jgi:hypothetical protein
MLNLGAPSGCAAISYLLPLSYFLANSLMLKFSRLFSISPLTFMSKIKHDCIAEEDKRGIGGCLMFGCVVSCADWEREVQSADFQRLHCGHHRRHSHTAAKEMKSREPPHICLAHEHASHAV